MTVDEDAKAAHRALGFGDAVYLEVALPTPLRRTFTYRAHQDTLGLEIANLSVGYRVAVPFRASKLVGVVTAIKRELPDVEYAIKDIGGIVDDAFSNPELFSFLTQAAQYYLAPLGEAFRAISPAIPQEANLRLRAVGFLDEKQKLKGLAISEKTDVWIERNLEKEAGSVRLGSKQVAFLERIPADGIQLSSLRPHFKNASQIVTALEKKGLISRQEDLVDTATFFRNKIDQDVAPPLLPEQQFAVKAINAALNGSEKKAFLLHGVTGSGKTEVYLHALEQALALGKSAILIVPEISLTPQLVDRVRARLGRRYCGAP